MCGNWTGSYLCSSWMAGNDVSALLPSFVCESVSSSGQPSVCVCLYLRHAGQTSDTSLNTQIFLDRWIQQRKCRVIFPQRFHTIGMPSGINTEHIDKKSVPACVETSPHSRLGTEEAGAAVESLPDITSPDPASTCLFVFVCAVRRRWLVGVMTTCSVPQAKMWRAGRPQWPAAPRLPPRDPLPTTSWCRSAGRGLSLHRWGVLPVSLENYVHKVKMFQRCIWCPFNTLFPHFHTKFKCHLYLDLLQKHMLNAFMQKVLQLESAETANFWLSLLLIWFGIKVLCGFSEIELWHPSFAHNVSISSRPLQKRTREKLVNVLSLCGQEVGLTKNPSVRRAT